MVWLIQSAKPVQCNLVTLRGVALVLYCRDQPGALLRADCVCGVWFFAVRIVVVFHCARRFVYARGLENKPASVSEGYPVRKAFHVILKESISSQRTETIYLTRQTSLANAGGFTGAARKEARRVSEWTSTKGNPTRERVDHVQYVRDSVGRSQRLRLKLQ